MLPGLISEKVGKPEGCPSDLDGAVLFSQLEMTDWSEAGIRDVCHYLRGSTKLLCPLRWKNVFPTTL